jgi:hypothetical protein
MGETELERWDLLVNPPESSEVKTQDLRLADKAYCVFLVRYCDGKNT